MDVVELILFPFVWIVSSSCDQNVYISLPECLTPCIVKLTGVFYISMYVGQITNVDVFKWVMPVKW